MKQAIFVIILFFSISCVAQQPPRPNPCKAWYDMIEQAKKTNKLSPEQVALVNAQVKKAGCTSIEVRDWDTHEALYKTAGTTSRCPCGIPGIDPERPCTYSIDFRTMNTEPTENKN